MPSYARHAENCERNFWRLTDSDRTSAETRNSDSEECWYVRWLPSKSFSQGMRRIRLHVRLASDGLTGAMTYQTTNYIKLTGRKVRVKCCKDAWDVCAVLLGKDQGPWNSKSWLLLYFPTCLSGAGFVDNERSHAEKHIPVPFWHSRKRSRIHYLPHLSSLSRRR